MTFVRRLFAVAFWFALLGGLVWTDKVSLGDDEPRARPPVLAERVLSPADLPAQIEFNRAGSYPARLGLFVRDDRDAVRVGDRWREVDPEQAGRLVLTIEPDEGPAGVWSVDCATLKVIDSIYKEKRSMLVLAGTELAIDRAVSARVDLALEELAPEGRAAGMLERLGLILGDPSEDLVAFTAEDPRPGLLLLTGLAGVFGHLVMILGRLVIPFRTEALPDELV